MTRRITGGYIYLHFLLALMLIMNPLRRAGAAKNEMDREAVEEEQRWHNLSFKQKAGDWALRHRWHLFVAGWATSMGVSWLILQRNKTQTFSQKLVQARVYVSVEDTSDKDLAAYEYSLA